MRPDSPFTATVETDLRNLVNAEESFFADHVEYSSILEDLRFHPSVGVRVTMQGATPRTWSAIATHPELPDWVCGIYVGGVAPHNPDQNQAEPTWWNR